MNYEPVIGLEIHAQLKTKTKMFCDSKNDSDEKHPNVNICPICTGQPGTLPVANLEAIKKTILLGMALDCRIAEHTFFERKNYFYPDLPKGYQISQYQAPLCERGELNIKGKKIRVRRVHIEEDTGRLFHDPKGKYSLIDFNRAGVPLLELVTEPDLHSGEEVRKFGEELQMILRYLGISDADMQKGQMRVEVNMSLRKSGEKLGTKVELKNINSFRYAAQAVDYEIKRQTEVLEDGKKVIQETRGWDEVKQKTFSQRTKEEAQDYRYFPEPDLPPINTKDLGLEGIRAMLVELPSQRRERFKKLYNLPEHDIEVLTLNKQLGDYFEKVVSELNAWDKLSHLKKPPKEHEEKLIKLAANYLITELAKLLYERGTGLEEMDYIKITPENFAEFIARIYHQEVSSSGAQALLKEMFETGEDPSVIIEKKDLAQVSDAEELAQAAQEVIAENPKPVEDYKKGKKESLQFLVGLVMKKTKGKANPQVAREILEKELS
ncbi:MAG: glutaminyl-tRNA synthase (glutamine-hydrolyzing) subunit B [Parcubacteria group bacterium RIFCSPHIGHO2_01_FULL_40_30]|nr:MAG: glutaminyl-tRNA synthase (glutamine-hydrolyzing) subunit B [Parcubacteria group bacterium RIFCSPHIGHO2_01_FULL_40_30]OHB24251.1 MAG: glutaminyl-tRNA synthase (glutamine-hydrolyzing) subunit B [Parcubacteria group bacterium RIFCSPLOWO2_12_FULL_40_10]